MIFLSHFQVFNSAHSMLLSLMSCQVIPGAASWLVWWLLVYCFAVLHQRHCYFRRIMLHISSLECIGETHLRVCIYIFNSYLQNPCRKTPWKIVFCERHRELIIRSYHIFHSGNKQVHEGKITYQKKDVDYHYEVPSGKIDSDQKREAHLRI